MEFFRKLGGFLNRKTIDADLEEEIRTHLEMKAETSGDVSAARRQFGNTTIHFEDAREQWRWPSLDAWARDFRYAVRMALRKPGFSLTVVLTLGLAIGSASTIYSLIDTVVIRPLPYPSPERLVALNDGRRMDERSRTLISPGKIEDWQQLSSTFESIAGSYGDTFTDTSGEAPERISGAFVSPRFFSVMGVPPAVGRVFTAEEERFGGPKTAVISDAFWQRRFAADRQAIGRTLSLSGERYTIVGVMPPVFRYPSPMVEVWLSKQARPELLKVREARFYFGVGRLKPGVSLEQAARDLDAVGLGLAETYPKTEAGWNAVVLPLKQRVVGDTTGALWILAGAVSVLLLIGCANVACLLLARLQARSAEMATRRSLGAGRAALARQLMAEGLVYALSGGLFGLAAAHAGVGLLRERLTLPRIAELAVDSRMLALVTTTSLFAALLFSLAPVLQSARRDFASGLLRAGRGVAGTRQRLPRLLVACQFALATALLIGAGLFLRTLARLEDAPLGFRHDGVFTFHIGASFNERPEATVARHQRILDALARVPGVSGVAMSTGLPAANSTWPREFQIVGEKTPDGSVRFTSWRMVTSGYFQTLGIPLLSGRTCRMNTDPDHPFELVVNRRFAQQYFGGREAVGRFIEQGPQGESKSPIVGVVADVREDGHSREAPPVVYGCGYLRFWPDPDYLVRTSAPAAVAALVHAIEPWSPYYAARELPDAISAALGQARFRTLVVTLFSSMALTLAAIGLYGVMAYTVSRRSREFGIRLALGARRTQIVGNVLRSGAMLAAGGAAAGVAIGAGATKFLGTLLYGVRPFDVVSYAGAVGALFAVALLACLIPARRAVSIHPIETLREQ